MLGRRRTEGEGNNEITLSTTKVLGLDAIVFIDFAKAIKEA
jgi:hypothetical protein